MQAEAYTLFKGIRLLKGKALKAANIKCISVSIGCNTLEIQSRYCTFKVISKLFVQNQRIVRHSTGDF